ncbi:MAG: methionine synthase, partial [Flavobacteriaceae bacterium]|nr:methionine synthase [Flavobacteriaceae bacterium]
HVNDASRAVTVVGDLLNKKTSEKYISDLKSDYDEFRTKFLSRTKKKKLVSLDIARKNKFKIDWKTSEIKKPNKLGTYVLEHITLDELLPYIDWSPFFRSWDLQGKYPAILEDKVVGEQATELFADAQKLLKEIVSKKLLKTKAVFGLFPANTINDDDIEISVTTKGSESAVETSRSKNYIFRTLRQQLDKKEGRPNFALSDFIAPKESGVQDYMGCFCVSTGFGTKELAEKYEAQEDDYNAIMVKALADRFAEAYAEYLHKEIRTNYWGYSASEDLSNDDLIKESYKGIRPAPGYPSCPDHTEKQTIWEVLKVKENIGVELTDSLAMWPAASVSGYYFGNKEAKYFGLGKIKLDQVEDFANRKGMDLETAKKWLNPNIVDS